MTREEAITVLKAFMENPLFNGVHKQAFNIAIHDIKQHHDWDINKLMLVSKTEWKQESTTKNDLGVDAVSRQAVLDLIADYDLSMGQVVRGIHALPSVTPQELKPMVEIDLYSVIKQKYIEREVLDKLRAEIKTMFPHTAQDEYWDGYDSCRNDVLHILDKYKTGFEPQESEDKE